MIRDPIVEDVRRVRAKLLASAGGDLDKLMDRLAEQETRHKGRMVEPKDLRGKKNAASSR
jgi:hypothetical protein